MGESEAGEGEAAAGGEERGVGEAEAGEGEAAAGGAERGVGESEEGDGKTEAGELAGGDLRRVLESLIFVSDKPLPLTRLRDLTGVRDAGRLREALEILAGEYRGRGLILEEVAGGYQFHTCPSTAQYVQKLVEGKPVRLSRTQLETLAIVAYRQPITRPEIDDIRGVDSGATLKVLLDRNLIRILGKREEPGRPLLYGTTREFLEFFHLSHISELPTLREYHELTEDSMRQVEKLSAELGERDPGLGFKDAPGADAAAESAPGFGPAEGDGSPDSPGVGRGDEPAPEAGGASGEADDPGDSGPQASGRGASSGGGAGEGGADAGRGGGAGEGGADAGRGGGAGEGGADDELDS